MTMNRRIFRQTEGKWSKLPYPGGGYKIAGCGCGCVAVTHVLIEDSRYEDWTPSKVQPYMKQFAIKAQGTTWAGITKSLNHYGMVGVRVFDNEPMSEVFKECNKGSRKGILLFGSTKGPDGTVWTTGGHFIAFVDYKVKDGKHWFYLKDSGGRKHDGWYCYEKSMRRDVRCVWTCTVKEATTAIKPSMTEADIKAAQKALGTKADGKISGQKEGNYKYYPAIPKNCLTFTAKGSSFVKALQRKIGAKPDGILGKNTITKLQQTIGVVADGIWGDATTAAFKVWIAKQNPPKPEPKLLTTAKALAWPAGTPVSKYTYGKGSATKAFREALAKVYPTHNKWSAKPSKGCSCDVFVGVNVRTAGIDSKFPRGLDEQVKYTSKHFKRSVYKNTDPYSVSQPGDVVMYGNSKDWIHVCIRGKDCIYEAQYHAERYGHVGDISKLKKKRARVVILRPV